MKWRYLNTGNQLVWIPTVRLLLQINRRIYDLLVIGMFSNQTKGLYKRIAVATFGCTNGDTLNRLDHWP
ncbi:hypothetical protein [Flavobacterium sp. UBA4197]|uniref:hypothetical protein n=1 Tax=Flavobacterium sp. UBA4197 TaxID=1946546 RepID=UPI00257A4B5E|nr:hypothetical protein [Flavobacterium sp. UBA4197]